jgi:broad specificity phosphatase PhoE
MKTYYIFRHGETFATKAGTGYGMKVFSAPLLPEATPSLQRMGQYLKDIPTDFAVSSAVKRCRQTVEIIGKESGKEFVFDKRLNEFFLESVGHLVRRLKKFLDDIETHKYEHVVICTHGACISALITLLTAKKDHQASYNLFNYPPPGVLTIIEGNNIQDVNFNIKV